MQRPWNQAEKINKLHFWGRTMLLQHDNAKPHTSVTSAAVETTSFEVVPHLLYSQDLELSDFYLLEALKKHLKSTCFT
jgi:hypothetical protein